MAGSMQQASMGIYERDSSSENLRIVPSIQQAVNKHRHHYFSCPAAARAPSTLDPQLKAMATFKGHARLVFMFRIPEGQMRTLKSSEKQPS